MSDIGTHRDPLATYRDWADTEFEPVPEFQSTEGKRKFSETLAEVELGARMTFGVLRQTKAELIESYKKLIAKHSDEEEQKELIMCLPDYLKDTLDLVKSLAELIESAHTRVLCVLSNCVEDDASGDRAAGQQ